MRNTLANLLLVIDEAWLDHSASIASRGHISSQEHDMERFLMSCEFLLTGVHRSIEQDSIDCHIIKVVSGLPSSQDQDP
jgi:hypothetical protein